jgi:hypothetical protein
MVHDNPASILNREGMVAFLIYQGICTRERVCAGVERDIRRTKRNRCAFPNWDWGDARLGPTLQ